MKASTGINESAYLGARWYALSKIHILDMLKWCVTDEKSIAGHLFDVAWGEICEKFGDLNRNEFVPVINAAFDTLGVTFYHKEQYEKAKRARKT